VPNSKAEKAAERFLLPWVYQEYDLGNSAILSTMTRPSLLSPDRFSVHAQAVGVGRRGRGEQAQGNQSRCSVSSSIG
jgi:hypothetical protein